MTTETYHVMEMINDENNERRPTGPGWRHFHCIDCNYRWKWPCRDCYSPSSENCPQCDERCEPYYNELDLTIPCDKFGNLTVQFDWDGTTKTEP